MAQQIVLGIPPAILSLVQTGLLERAFHDGLYPAMLFRGEAAFEEWEGNTGQEIYMTRAGLLAPVTTPLTPGVDPTPVVVSYEQWAARLARYASTIDTHMPTSAVANANLFVRNIQQLGLQAGQSINRLPRNALFQAYLSGQTALVSAASSADTSIRVASCNGFADALILANSPRPQPVSSGNPLPIVIMNGASAINANVIGVSPDNSADPNGPGALVLLAAVGANVASRSSVLSTQRPKIIRAGGGSGVDAITSGDVFTLQQAINATNWLRKNNVAPHEDGFYHGHINTDASSQTFQDPAFQRLNTSMPDGSYYQQAALGTIAGIAFYNNNEAPDYTNSGARQLTGTTATYSVDIGADTVNESGVNIGRIVITGKGAIYEKGLDESAYVSEAGITGKIGDFTIANAGVTVSTDRIKLILRAPLNRLQDEVAATWSITTCFPVPSDVSAGGPQRYKRAVVIEHALDG